MKIADLFVNLGLTGADTAKKQLVGVKEGIGDIKSMSLEAKAAIIAAIYALERMMSSSMKAGTGFANFSASTGLSAQKLQEWQYAMRLMGGTSEEATASIKGVQNAMTNMLLGKGAPEGMAMLANKVGFDERRARDTFYVLGKIREFMQVVPPDVGMNLMKSFGVSEGMLTGMIRGGFADKILASAPRLSMKDIFNLDQTNIAWEKLNIKIDMMIKKFVAMHGLEITNDISKAVTEMLKLVDAAYKLSKAMHVFEALRVVIDQIVEGLKAISTMAGIVSDISGDDKKKKEGAMRTATDFFDSIGLSIGSPEEAQAVMKKMRSFGPAPMLKPLSPSEKGGEMNFNQNFNFSHPGTDHKKTGDSVQKAINNSYWSAHAQGGH